MVDAFDQLAAAVREDVQSILDYISDAQERGVPAGEIVAVVTESLAIMQEQYGG